MLYKFMEMSIMKNVNIFNDLIETGTEEQHTKNNGEDIMKPNKGIVKPLTKKEFKALSKGQAESINADCEIRNDCTDELAIKAEMVDDFKKSINRNNKKIAAAKRDIKQGFEVNRNKKRIRDIEAQNRYLLNQINGFNATINEFQNKKIIINKNIVSKKDNYKTLENAWATVSAFLK